MGLYSLSGKLSYREISWSLEVARFVCYNDREWRLLDWHEVIMSYEYNKHKPKQVKTKSTFNGIS